MAAGTTTRVSLPQNAKGVLLYAAKWGYFDIVDAAASVVVLETSLSEILPLLPVDLVIPWVIIALR